MRGFMTGAFGVPGENNNGRRVVEFCAEWGLCVDYTNFEHKYIRVARVHDGVEAKSMIDLVLVKKDMLFYVLDVEWNKTSQITMLYCVKSGWWGMD